jgi:hypothetical protein
LGAAVTTRATAEAVASASLTDLVIVIRFLSGDRCHSSG